MLQGVGGRVAGIVLRVGRGGRNYCVARGGWLQVLCCARGGGGHGYCVAVGSQVLCCGGGGTGCGCTVCSAGITLPTLIYVYIYICLLIL